MSSSVTKDGISGTRPGREATTGVNVGPIRDGDRRRRGEQPVVPDAEFSSYYGMPVLNAPIWKEREIGGYLFLGGLAGASSLLAAGAQLTGRPQLATRAKIVATGAIALGGAALVKDLGKPARFANMLRVFKPTSPMNIGAWLLAAYGPATATAAASAVTGRANGTGVVATGASALLGPAVATYTAALVADTAVPAWHAGQHALPFVFAGSSAISAGGMGLLCAPAEQAAPAQRLALAGAAIEAVASWALERRGGVPAEPYRQGRAGRLMRAARVLTIGGLAIAWFGPHHRLSNVLAGSMLTASSAVTRAGVFAAGTQSVADPRFVVEPQRRRSDSDSRPAASRGLVDSSARKPPL